MKRSKRVRAWAVVNKDSEYVDIHFEKKIALSVLGDSDKLLVGYFQPKILRRKK